MNWTVYLVFILSKKKVKFFFLPNEKKSSVWIRHDLVLRNPVLCYAWSLSSGGRVSLSLLAETIYVGHCPTSIALAPALRISCVRIPNYFVRSKLDLFYPEGKCGCLLI